MLQVPEQKLDIEKALFASNAKSPGTQQQIPCELAGAPTWMITNVDFQSGNSGANPTVMGPMRRLMTELQPHFHRQSSTLFFSLCGKWRHTLHMLFVCIPDE